MVGFGGLKFGKRENMSDRRIWRERESRGGKLISVELISNKSFSFFS